jgi:hypothetical protein
MKYANQHAVTRFALIAIVPMLLAVPLPAGAGEIHGQQTTGHNVSLGNSALARNTRGKRNTALGHGALNRNTSGEKNTAVGTSALLHNTGGKKNTAVGSGALWKNRSHKNTAIGVSALEKNTGGNSNTASGVYALYKNTRGDNNTASGVYALSSNTEGSHNTASGVQALTKNTRGNNNTASGVQALTKNTRGNNNTASGFRSLYSNTDGLNNTASGSQALLRNTSGSENTVLGAEALLGNLNGSQNTVLGYKAAASSTTGSNNVYIGYRAGDNTTYHNLSNKLVIANGNTLDDELISGSFSEHVVDINGQLNVHVLTQSTSDGRLKKDIQPLTDALDTVLKLQGKSYAWRTDEYPDLPLRDGRDIGLVAQDVEAVLSQVVSEDSRGYKGIAYQMLTAVLIEAIKEQQNQITALQQENQQLKSAMVEQMDALLARVAMLEGIKVAQQ